MAVGNSGAYTGYAFAKGYTTGVIATTFDPNEALRFRRYVTFGCGRWAMMTAQAILPSLPHWTRLRKWA